MRILILAATVSALAAPAFAAAQTTAAPVGRTAAPAASRPAPAAAAPAPVEPLGPPRAFQGYVQPEVAAGACKVVNPGQTTCTVPAMTAGRYLIEAAGASTATAPGATQKLAILLGNQVCGMVERRPPPDKPWVVGTVKTLRNQCEVELLTDRPLNISAVYVDDKANKAAGGPTLTIKRLPWDGVVSFRQITPAQE